MVVWVKKYTSGSAVIFSLFSQVPTSPGGSCKFRPECKYESSLQNYVFFRLFVFSIYYSREGWVTTRPYPGKLSIESGSPKDRWYRSGFNLIYEKERLAETVSCFPCRTLEEPYKSMECFSFSRRLDLRDRCYTWIVQL